ncbi:hypothetical protein BGZ61DRAFT_214353 [Ilyonectria robusta]|uniref:uncharacterized protein n=1 Tax=Ilyonectria robusta TaxID=1079257 RepID=UPI001E8D9CFB|nr:uncharacterized protein BGZ61DRAFT_214353 [Ilyonectria robusta]KAH8652929.1 hypothetical protein BGZ61DRAFT_214353 [Ilyonectria robusta]
MNQNEGRGALGVRLSLGQASREPRVIQIACCQSPNCLECRRSRLIDPYYFRVSCRLSTFLQQDVADLSEEQGAPLEADQNSLSIHNELDKMALHRYLDILWLHFDATMETARELRQYYGRQLDHFKNVIIDETGIWSHLDQALEIMEPFRNIQIVHVWLESNRYSEESPPRTREEYLERARELQRRDWPALIGRNWIVNYIDDDGHIYGGFRANRTLPWRPRLRQQ